MRKAELNVVVSAFEDNIFDYRDEAIALRTLASLHGDVRIRPLVGEQFLDSVDEKTALAALAGLQQDARLHSIVLDALWINTRERALFLFNRVCCVLNAHRVETLLADVERLASPAEGFLSTSRIPSPELNERLGHLLTALGFEMVPESAHRAGPGADERWEYHQVVADMRSSRFAGTGKGGEKLAPLEDAIRRLKVILIAANHLTPEKNGGAPVHISGDFGPAEVLALREYVGVSLGKII